MQNLSISHHLCCDYYSLSAGSYSSQKFHSWHFIIYSYNQKAPVELKSLLCSFLAHKIQKPKQSQPNSPQYLPFCTPPTHSISTSPLPSPSLTRPTEPASTVVGTSQAEQSPPAPGHLQLLFPLLRSLPSTPTHF